MEEFLGAGRGAGLDQRTDIGVTGGDDSIERGYHEFEGFELFQAPHVGLAGIDERALGREIRGGLIFLLAGNYLVSKRTSARVALICERSRLACAFLRSARVCSSC